MESYLIIGIDPGLANTGWGIIEKQRASVRALAYGCITTSAAVELPARLAIIHDNLIEIIDRYKPAALSVEGIYFGANSKSALLTAQARGAALVACSYMGLEYGEYTPMQIKQTLVGTGAADKEQVQYMVRAVLGLDHEPKPDHAADALAAAITHARLRKAYAFEHEAGKKRSGAGLHNRSLSQCASKGKFEQRVAAALRKEKQR